MKQLTYILLVIGIIQLLLTVCSLEGKKHRSDKSHRSDRSERGRAAKKGAAKKKGSGKLESEDFCTKGEECESGNCCPIPLVSKQKACYKEDCSVAKIGQGKNANPATHEWKTDEKYYKLFIKEYSNVLEATWKCCAWKKTAKLAVVRTDEVYNNVYPQLVEGMKTKQNANKADSNIEATVRIDGNDIDQNKSKGKQWQFMFATDLEDSQRVIQPKMWYAAKGQPNTSFPLMDCVGIKYYSSAPAQGSYKFATVPCQSMLPFLCEASVKPYVPGKKKAPDAGKKKAPDAGKKKKGK